MRRIVKQLVIAGTTMALSACSGGVFYSIDDDYFAEGLTYHLPRSLVTVIIEPVGFEKDQQVTKVPISLASEMDSADVAHQSIIVRNRPHKVLVDQTGALKKALVVDLNITSLDEKTVPDTDFAYTLQYNNNVFFSDRVCAANDADGLLQYVQATTKDETGQITIALGKLFGRLAGPGGIPFAAPNLAVLSNRTITMTIDPFNQRDLQAVERKIEAYFPEMRGRYKFQLEEGANFGLAASKSDCPKGQICYRTRVPIRLGLKDTWVRGTGETYTQKVAVQVINRSRTVGIDIKRAFLVEKLSKLRFENGVLDKVIMRKPSQGLAAAKLPLTLVDAIMTSALAAPGDFLKGVVPKIGATDANAILRDYTLAVDELGELMENLEKGREEDFGYTEAEKPLAPFKTVCTSTETTKLLDGK